MKVGVAVYASVDLGGTNIKAALAEADGRVICAKSMPTLSYEGPGRVLQRIGDLVNDLVKECGVRPAGLGMAVPGLVDLNAGVTKFLPNFPTQWRDVRVREMLEPTVTCPVYLMNDVRTATLGELTFGHGKNGGTMVFFALGTGIGGGVAIDGKLRLGPLGAAGEIGHQIVELDGKKCGCGARGCLETVASGPAITAEGVRLMLNGLAPKLHELVRGDVSQVTTKEMAMAAEAGDENVKDVIVRAARFLGVGVVNVVVALHPDLVVLGGGVAQIGDLLFDTVRQTMKESVGMFPTDGVHGAPSMLGDPAGLWGGVALAWGGSCQG